LVAVVVALRIAAEQAGAHNLGVAVVADGINTVQVAPAPQGKDMQVVHQVYHLHMVLVEVVPVVPVEMLIVVLVDLVV
jgi:hypothetical protein